MWDRCKLSYKEQIWTVSNATVQRLALDRLPPLKKMNRAERIEASPLLHALHKIHARMLEQQAINLGFVHKHANPYVSDKILTRRREQKKRNRHTLDGLLATNELGQSFTLSELVEKGLAVPNKAENSTKQRGALQLLSLLIPKYPK